MSVIDHTEQRERIATIAADIIGREGLEGTTVRRIAAEAGCSTTVVTHYFASKDELLLSAYRFIWNQAIERLDELLARDPLDLVGSLASLIPSDPETLRGWGVYMSFWERAKLDPVFGAEQQLWAERALTRVVAMIRAHSGGREDVRTVAQMLIAIVYGISVQALFDPKRCSPEQTRAILVKAVDMIFHQSSDEHANTV
jgi:TetR/AcrR family transcriptional regulator, transcriptional repressor of bet genes